MPSHIIFEPWGLGDVVIAASVLRACNHSSFAIVCSQKWKTILCGLIPEFTDNKIIGCDLDYTYRGRLSKFQKNKRPMELREVKHTFSIRGDPRDYRIAKNIFPNAKIHMNGWLFNAAYHFPIFDHTLSCLKIDRKTRYELWTDLLNVNKNEFFALYRNFNSKKILREKCAIHIGAQWQSKQYPYVKQLSKLLTPYFKEMRILSGKDDKLPFELSEDLVTRAEDLALLDHLKSIDVLISNDTSIMHIAALLQVPTLVIARMANIDLWAPPGVLKISSKYLPKGYAPEKGFASDKIFRGWPTPEEVKSKLLEHLP